MENQVPDPFSPGKIMAVLDSVSHSYSRFVAVNVTEPAQVSFNVARDNVRWVVDNSDQQVLAYTGLSSLAQVPAAPAEPARPQVAGAVTYSPSIHDSIVSVQSLYGLLRIK
jgi:hypothetical protein